VCCGFFSFCLWVYRKADLRELKVLQKTENKQYQDLALKAEYMREQQAKRFEQEMQVRQLWNILRNALNFICINSFC
jgi:hypothetical protein